MIDELMTWAKGWDGYTKLNAIVNNSNDIALVIAQSIPTLREFINGHKEKEVTFALTAMLDYSSGSDDTNLVSYEYMESWRTWLEAKNEAQDYPAIGTRVESIEVLDSNPYMALSYENGVAKYMFQAQMTYID